MLILRINCHPKLVNFTVILLADNPSGNNYWKSTKCHNLLSFLQIDKYSSLFRIVIGAPV